VSEHNPAIIKLHEFRSAFKPYSTGATPQTVGYESYRIICTGNALSVIDEVCEEIYRLEQANAELRRELDELRKGEFICKKCGIRKDSEHQHGDF
jgi:hypothetical protein